MRFLFFFGRPPRCPGVHGHFRTSINHSRLHYTQHGTRLPACLRERNNGYSGRQKETSVILFLYFTSRVLVTLGALNQNIVATIPAYFAWQEPFGASRWSQNVCVRLHEAAFVANFVSHITSPRGCYWNSLLRVVVPFFFLYSITRGSVKPIFFVRAVKTGVDGSDSVPADASYTLLRKPVIRKRSQIRSRNNF